MTKTSLKMREDLFNAVKAAMREHGDDALNAGQLDLQFRVIFGSHRNTWKVDSISRALLTALVRFDFAKPSPHEFRVQRAHRFERKETRDAVWAMDFADAWKFVEERDATTLALASENRKGMPAPTDIIPLPAGDWFVARQTYFAWNGREQEMLRALAAEHGII